MKKFAVVSPLLPPSKSGQPLVLNNLLRTFSPDDYCLVSEADYSDIRNNESSGKLDCKYFQIRFFFNNHFFNRLVEKYLLKLFFFLPESHLENFIEKRAKAIERILENENCEAVVACTGSIFDPVAAYYASRNLGIKFIFYIFDMYSHQFPFSEGIEFTKKYEDILVKNADTIILTNEFVCNTYLDKYGVKGMIIHNPLSNELLDRQNNFMVPGNRNHDLEILYTGSIYAAHYDSFRNLVKALDKIQKAKLRIITSQKKFILRIKGINGPVIYEKNKSQLEIFELQKRADILFLPLAFNSPYPELIKNSSPGKMGEYLASGRPVLLHSPADTFLSWYFRQNNCGIVVDKDDSDLLAEKLNEIIDDRELVEVIVANALKCAKRDFSPVLGSEKLKSILD